MGSNISRAQLETILPQTKKPSRSWFGTSNARSYKMSTDKFRGWPYDEIKLPSGDKIICTYSWDGSEPKRTLEDANHNIFRLDKDGNVIWQIKREEQGKIRWDLIMEEIARNGEASTRFSRIPFGELWLEDNEGRRFKSDRYIPGCKLIALASGGRSYEVDIEIGIAINITGAGDRLW